MTKVARLAALGAALAAVSPFALATPIISGHLNTAGAANYSFPPETFTVSSTGAATLALITPGSASGSNTGLVTGPAPTGTLANFFPAGIVTDYSFSTSTIAAATPTEIWSISNGTDTIGFFATSTGAFTPTDLPTTEGTLVLYGYLADIGGNYTNNYDAELDIAVNGIGNNFTEDLMAPAPEPSSLMLLGTGLMGTGGFLFRRFRKTIS